MARLRQPSHTHTPKIVTPDTGEAQQLTPITFGSFLPLKFHTIMEKNVDSSAEDVIHLENTTGKDTPKRRLQFSDAGTSMRPTPAVPEPVRGNRSNGKTLNFIPPMIKEGILTVQIDEEDICLQVQEWETALIGYVIGHNLYDLQMTEYVKKVWGFVELPQVFYHDDGYYVFKFHTIADKERVMQAGPYFYGNKPMILRNWQLDFEFNADMFSQIPIWVKFPRLPVGYWSVKALSKVASAIGVPLYTDGFTAKAEKISYARVLIEVDITKTLPDAIVVETPSGPWNQSIEYEWRPKFCNHCLKLGHMDAECWYKHSPSEGGGETELVGAEKDHGKGRRKEGRRRRMITKWIPIHYHTNVKDNTAIIGSNAEVLQTPLERDPGQRSGKQHVEETSLMQNINNVLDTQMHDRRKSAGNYMPSLPT
ncbi:hypothetical protein R3W88_014728 [Solanum pinnatisectum]|uniref:DUF4283 domain-containing protein n=1 Tax=Solanum pinnatisectum TaxID=50273 RepID=A0AAV9KVK8_9SOLN|nr:hypothetical protein R3W88_014728 [Solanum pinnatisectum]